MHYTVSDVKRGSARRDATNRNRSAKDVIFRGVDETKVGVSFVVGIRVESTGGCTAVQDESGGVVSEEVGFSFCRWNLRRFYGDFVPSFPNVDL